jgi:endonuclease G
MPMDGLMTPIQFTALLLAVAAPLAAQQDRFGNPACSGPDRELANRSFFVVCHSASRKTPVWVSYELRPEHLGGIAPRPSRFRRDSGLSHAGAADEDYRGSGFSRGHMAPAADFAWSEEAIRATFLLSNAAPQRQGVNAGLWGQLERAVRRIAAHSDAVYVFSGTIFDPDAAQTIGPGRVAVPSHTFKVVLALEGGRKTMFAAIVPNRAEVAEPLSAFATTVDEVERRTGLDFFNRLDYDEQRRLESELHNYPDAGLTSRNTAHQPGYPRLRE